MRAEFYPEEKLYRKIRPLEAFWDQERNRPTSGAFKDKRGLSVDRQGERDERDVIQTLDKHLPQEGTIVSVSHQQCVNIEIAVVYLPIPENVYHSELHDSPLCVPLSRIKAKRLSEIVNIFGV
ncbi:MAG: hypothetical protein WA234_07715 [Rectinemataceae bacterium]